MLELNSSVLIYIYAGLVIICIIYLYFYRQKLVKKQTEQTKRSVAIEKFQNYTKTAADLVSNQMKSGHTEGFANPELNLPSNQKQAALGAKCLQDGNTSAIPDMPTIPDDEFLIPGLFEKIHERVIKQTLKRGQDLILNNIVLALTKDVITHAGDVYNDIRKLYMDATPSNEFSQEEQLGLFFNNLDSTLTTFITTKLDNRLNTAFEQSQILTTNQATVNQAIIQEIKERVFARIYTDAKTTYAQYCRSQSELGQKLESATAAELRFRLLTQQIQRRLMLSALIKLTESPETIAAIQAELSRLKDSTIQPALEADLDTINSRRMGRMGMAVKESQDQISGIISGLPSANAYKSYLDSVARREMLTKIDPISALDKMEKSTIGFLEQLGLELGPEQFTSSSIQQPSGKSAMNNRFVSQPSNLGSYLHATKTKETKEISINNSSSRNNTGSIKEGFADQTTTTTTTASKIDERTLAGQITGWAKYVYDFLKSHFDSELTAQAEKILTDENNMLPIGIILIMASILLYFIDLSS